MDEVELDGAAVVAEGVAVVDAGAVVVVVAVVALGVAVVVAGVELDEDEAHTVFFVGEIVNAVTEKSGVPPTVHVQHGSPNASPLVMLIVESVVLKSALQNAPAHVSEAASKAVAKSVYCDESSFG